MKVTIALPAMLSLSLLISGCSKQESKERSVGEVGKVDSLVVVHSADSSRSETLPPLKFLEPPDLRRNAIVILQTGDTTSGYTLFAYRWKTKSRMLLARLNPEQSKRYFDVSYTGVVAAVVTDTTGAEVLEVRRGLDTKTVPAPFHEQVMWSHDADTGAGFRSTAQFPPFTLAPDGSSLLALQCSDYAFSDTSHGTVTTEVGVARLTADDSHFEWLYRDTISTPDYLADAGFSRYGAGWVYSDPLVLLITDFYPGQLTHEEKHLWACNPKIGSFRLASPAIEKYLGSSLDGRYVLYTNNDETCCAGSNYTNNLLIVCDLGTGQSNVLFSEYETFHNEGKAEDHSPESAALSPDNQWVAATLSDFLDSTSKATSTDEPDSLYGGRRVIVMHADGSEQRTLQDQDMIGWLDERHLLLRQWTNLWDPQVHKWIKWEGKLLVFDVKDGTEVDFPDQSCSVRRIDWEPS